jgi:hypothetical protein
MTQTKIITVVGCIGAASFALSQVINDDHLKIVCVGVSTVCGAVCAYLAKGKADTGTQ